MIGPGVYLAVCTYRVVAAPAVELHTRTPSELYAASLTRRDDQSTARVEPFVQHLPEWIPAREALVYITGALEVALGITLMRSTRHRTTGADIHGGIMSSTGPATEPPRRPPNVRAALGDRCSGR